MLGLNASRRHLKVVRRPENIGVLNSEVLVELDALVCVLRLSLAFVPNAHLFRTRRITLNSSNSSKLFLLFGGVVSRAFSWVCLPGISVVDIGGVVFSGGFFCM